MTTMLIQSTKAMRKRALELCTSMRADDYDRAVRAMIDDIDLIAARLDTVCAASTLEYAQQVAYRLLEELRR